MCSEQALEACGARVLELEESASHLIFALRLPHPFWIILEYVGCGLIYLYITVILYIYIYIHCMNNILSAWTEGGRGIEVGWS